MSRKDLTARRARNRQIAADDWKLRCSYCRQALPAQGAVVRFDDGKKFCGDECADADEERDRLMVARDR